MNWSLILPTRERPELLEGLLQSLVETTEELDLIEAVVSVDDDDKPTHRVMDNLSKYKFIKWNTGPRRDNFSIHYYNEPALASNGKYVMALNDDTAFTTKGWDRLGVEAFESAPWLEALGKCDDGLGKPYPCFPVLTRSLLQMLGWMFHPEFRTWGADIHLHRVVSTCGRCIDLPFKVTHLCHHAGLRNQDHVNRRVARLATYNWGSDHGEAMRLQRLLDEIPTSL